MARLSRQEVAWALYDWAASAYALCILASKVKTEDPQVLYQYILSALVFPGEIMAPSAEIDIKRRAQKEKYIFENLPDVIESPGALLI